MAEIVCKEISSNSFKHLITNKLLTYKSYGRYPHGVMVKALNCGIVVSEFKF